jgi:hypothetical protein
MQCDREPNKAVQHVPGGVPVSPHRALRSRPPITQQYDIPEATDQKNSIIYYSRLKVMPFWSTQIQLLVVSAPLPHFDSVALALQLVIKVLGLVQLAVKLLRYALESGPPRKLAMPASSCLDDGAQKPSQFPSLARLDSVSDRSHSDTVQCALVSWHATGITAGAHHLLRSASCSLWPRHDP